MTIILGLQVNKAGPNDTRSRRLSTNHPQGEHDIVLAIFGSSVDASKCFSLGPTISESI